MLKRYEAWQVCAIAIGLAIALSDSADAAGPVKRFFRKRTSVDVLAKYVAKLEREIDYTGSIVAKVPDVWGQARLTQHREEFEKQMRAQLDSFSVSFNAEIARSDQAYLAEAVTLAATVNMSNQSGGTVTAPTFDVSTISNMVSPITGTAPASPAAPGNATQTQAGSNFTVIRNDPFATLKMGFSPTSNSSAAITLEPEVVLDQRKRFLNHLHEIRRINEGDDSADAPGYSLNLVRIPVSILPGDHTREGYGAEITITATPHVTEELLPQTFRSLVINDLVDQLAFPIVKYLDLAWPLLVQLEDLDARKRAYSAIKSDIDGLKNIAISSKTYDDFEKRISTMKRQDLVVSKNYLTNGVISEDLKNFYIESTDPQTPKKSSVSERYDSARTSINDVTLEIAKVDKELDKCEGAVAGLMGGLNQRSRRSRFAIPASQLGTVYGEDEIEILARKFFDLRDRQRCNWSGYLPEVQAFLHQELDAAYEFLTHRQVCKQISTNEVVSINLWGWVDPGLGHRIRSQLDQATESEIMQGRIPAYRDEFYQAIDGTPLTSSAQRDGRQQRRVKLASFQEEGSQPQLPPPPALRNQIEELAPPTTGPSLIQPAQRRERTVTEALAWAILVESVLLNDRLNEDLVNVSQDPNCHCQSAEGYIFYGPTPPLEARHAFMEYVRCRWPIHVFALDPETQQQNVADSYSMRRESQLAIALAFTQRFVNTQSLTRYMRRIEMDMRTIALNNTMVGFGHGNNTFGWRFTPRIQSPPFESNLTVIMRDLIVGGPNSDATLSRQRLETGPRECVAIVVMPSFIRHVKFETRTNWFRLTNKCMQHRGDSGPTMDYVLDWSRDIRQMQDAVMNCMADQHLYRDGDVERLLARVEQLSQELPMQTLHANVPNENTLGGFEMFSSGVTDLAPELIGFYGVPGIDPSKKTELFLVGNHFSVHDTRVMAGNQMCQVSMLSRQVMQVTVPPGVQIHKRRQMPPALPATEATTNSSRSTPTPIADLLHPDSQVPCSAHMDPNACPKLCNPCCNTEFVEFRIATPYGVTSSLEVPVVTGMNPPPQLAWGTDKIQITYYYGKPDAANNNNWSIADSDIRLAGDRRIVISATNGLTILGSSSASIEFSLYNQLSGISSISPVQGIPLDTKRQQYVVDGANFIAFHKALRAAVHDYVWGSGGGTPPDRLNMTIQATVAADNNTRLQVTSEIPVQITFVQKQ